MTSVGLVSVVMPAHNADRFLKESIESVVAQSYENWELLLVDDGSRDRTREIADAFARRDSRIRVFHHEKARGPAEARNTALENAKGQYVAFLDSDDVWLTEKLQVQVGLMKKHDWAMSFHEYRRMTVDGKEVGRLIRVPTERSYSQLLKHNVVGCLTAMVDVAKTGPIRMRAEGYDDFILWLDVLKRGYKAYGIQQDLARYRRVPGSVSFSWRRAARWVWGIYRDVEQLSLPKALWYFANYSIRVYTKHIQF